MADPVKLRRKMAYYLVDTEKNQEIKTEEDLPDISEDEALLDFMDTLNIKSEEMWYVLSWLRKPVCRLQQLSDMLKCNLPAFEKARESVKKPLEKLLQKKDDPEETKYSKIAESCGKDHLVYMSLGTPLAQIIMEERSYQGVLLGYLNAGRRSGNDAREIVIRQAKSLSDKSKLDILCDLKQSKKFNLELAESLGLSPSTVSHHMDERLAGQYDAIVRLGAV